MFACCIGSETQPGGVISALDGVDPCGRDGVSARSVHELDEFGLCGGVVGTVSLCWSGRWGSERLCWAIRGEWDLPQISLGITEAVKNDVVVVEDFDVVVIKGGCAAVVTQLSNGEERMCELWEYVPV